MSYKQNPSDYLLNLLKVTVPTEVYKYFSKYIPEQEKLIEKYNTLIEKKKAYKKKYLSTKKGKAKQQEVMRNFYNKRKKEKELLKLKELLSKHKDSLIVAGSTKMEKHNE